MNIIITGASKGIGYELTKLFAKDKHNTILIVASTKSFLEKLKNDCTMSYPESNVIPIVFDFEDPVNVKANFKHKILSYIDSLDILINNAGYLMNKPFIDMDLMDIKKIYNVNLFSHAIVIQELISLLNKSKIKHVVNISSMGGFQGSSKFPGLSIYSSVKAAFANLTECLAEEFKKENIKFNCLALGAVDTKMLRTAFPGYEAPLKAYEMAHFIYNFSINEYKFFNGKILPVSISTP